MRVISYSGAGGNEVVRLERREDPVTGEEQVLISVRFAGINPADILQRNGGYPVPPDAPQDVPGLEVAGEVLETGTRVTRWSVGDRVMGIVNGGGLADRVLAHQDHLVPIPESLAESDAAALPEAIVTAFDALTQVSARLGDTIAIRGINGGVGLASYQLAAAMGARPVGVGRSLHALDAVRDLGMDVIHEDDFAMEMANLGGPSVIVELVGGNYIDQDLMALAAGGRIIVVSVAGGARSEVPLNLLMGKRARLVGTVLRSRSNAEKSLLMTALRTQVMPLIADKKLTVPVDRVFPAADIHSAFDYLSGPGKVGKVLLDFIER